LALGTWDDFTSTWGFNDGGSIERRDYEARALIVTELNDTTGVKAARIRAVEYDRPGMHNACLILVLPNPNGKSDPELLTAWRAGNLETVELPESVLNLTDEIIAEAYEGDVHDTRSD